MNLLIRGFPTGLIWKCQQFGADEELKLEPNEYIVYQLAKATGFKLEKNWKEKIGV